MKVWIPAAVASLMLLGVVNNGAAQSLVVDHTSYPLFDSMPASVKAAAFATRFEFSDRSVGVNVWDAFRYCFPVAYGSAPSSCRSIKSGLQPETWTQVATNVTFHGWPGVGLPNEMAGCSGSNGVWTGYLPCWQSYVTPRLGSYDVIGMFPDYTLGSFSDSVANFWTVRPGNYDAFDMMNFEASISPKKMIYFGISIPKSDAGVAGSLQRLTNFNTAARAFAINNSKVFVDVGDIESHCWNGTLTRNAAGLPIQCDDWGSEAQGGHLTYGAAKVRMAKLFIVAVALANGWRPQGAPPPPPPSDTVPPTVTGLTCNRSGSNLTCTAQVGDNVGVVGGTTTVTVRDAAGNQATGTANVP